MERVALVGGIILAAFFALGSLVHIDIDGFDWDGGGRLAAYVEPAAEKKAEETYRAGSVRVRNAAAIVHVLAEDRTDVAVSFDNPGRAPSPVISRSGGAVVIDGRLSGRIRECGTDGAVTLRDYGALTRDALPVITIRAPRDLDLAFSGAVYGDVGPSASLELRHAGCGQVTAADTAGALDIHATGPGEVRIGSSRNAEARVSGSGSVTIGATGDLEASVSGSGALFVASAEGDAEVRIAGSGNFYLDGGALDDAELNAVGSGDLDISAPIRTLETRIVGSGSITVRRPVTDLDAKFVGSGDVILVQQPTRSETTSVGSGNLIINPAAAQAPPRPAPPAPPQAPAPTTPPPAPAPPAP